ncbi:hypothetical protein Fmac_028073 [Flemingia macrophylla]|uniref:Uncharacterized protein n=1 Tax=Flemingia macrophylla TaxID=520843 RepID=A0ABD1LJL1_9FABA
MGRAPCCEKVGLKKGRWTREEDEILAKYIEANGEGSWRSLPKNAGLLRCGKSCRLRWINYLRADLKRGNISAEEENTIVKLHASFGNRWSLIASHLPGRTDNEIKNYWNSHLSRKIYSFPKQVMDTAKAAAPLTPPPKRKGGRTSRWAMKRTKGYTQHNSTVAAAIPRLPEKEGLPKGDVAEVREEGSGKCEKSVEESSDDDILGLCQMEGINEGCGALGLSDMLETCEVIGNLISDERETNNVVTDTTTCHDKMASSESSVNGESGGEWSSEQSWDWESVIEFNKIADQSQACDQDKLLTWLWEDDDDDDWENGFKKLGQTDPKIQNDMDMVAWFLS